MAIIKLDNVVVSRVNRQGFGIQVAEEYEAAGKKRSTKWTVWFKEPHGLNVGDKVSVSGFYSDKTSSFENEAGETKWFTERSVNSPRVDSVTAGAGSAVAAFGGYQVDETPF